MDICVLQLLIQEKIIGKYFLIIGQFFKEKFEYEKRDIPFIVELDDGNGNYIDVGIRDYHRPVSDYNLLLKKNRFLNTVVSEIYKNYDYPYALLFDAQK